VVCAHAHLHVCMGSFLGTFIVVYMWVSIWQRACMCYSVIMQMWVHVYETDMVWC